MSTRRKAANGAPSTPARTPSRTSSYNSPAAQTNKAPNTMLSSPFLPTKTEAVLLSFYPLTLLLGSLFSTLSPYLSPPTNLSTYSYTHQSYQPASLAPSYFATKRNIFNLYFVKIGWFWSTLALFCFTLLAARGRAAIDVGFATGNARREEVLDRKAARLSDLDEDARAHEKDARLRRIWQVALRWILCTLAWMTATQWFFGPSLIDRVFALTGGMCVAADDPLKIIPGAENYGACRRKGGRFAGGWDISGHVFLLMLGSAMVFAEALPIVLPWIRGLTSQRVIRVHNNIVYAEDDAVTEKAKQEAQETPGHGYGTRSAARAKVIVEQQSQRREKPWTTRAKEYALWLTSAVVLLSWWMLLMTAAFFHTWLEKGSALFLAAATIWCIYTLPRGSERLRLVVGLPGM